MSKIIVTVKKLNQANEIIDYWRDKNVEVCIEAKENTATDEGDVINLGNNVYLSQDSRTMLNLKNGNQDYTEVRKNGYITEIKNK